MLAGLMVPFGFATAVEAARRGLGTPGLDAVQLMIFPMGSIVLFAGFMTAAIVLRRKPELHRRLIMLATIAILPPAIARMPFVGLKPVVALLLSLLFVVAGMVYDKQVRGRVHRLYLIGFMTILLSGPVRFGVGHTAAWRSLAEALIGTDVPATSVEEHSDVVDWKAVRAMPVEAVMLGVAGLGTR